jgi:hypothetical protein
MDPEIKAMGDLANALKDLEPDQVRRVLKWANERYQPRSMPASASAFVAADGDTASAEFGEFHELFDAARPTSGLDKVLVAAYWYQAVLKHEELDSQDLNKELKHMGYASTNITRDLDHLINRSPRVIIQVRKEGKHKQARKRYKLTREGIRAVEKMLATSDMGTHAASES